MNPRYIFGREALPSRLPAIPPLLGDGTTAAALAARLGVSPKCVRRDLATLYRQRKVRMLDLRGAFGRGLWVRA